MKISDFKLPSRPRYLARALQLANASREAGMLPAGLSHMVIRHDEGCPALTRNAPHDCTCEPDIEIASTEEVLAELKRQ